MWTCVHIFESSQLEGLYVGACCVIHTKVTHDLAVVTTSLRYPIWSGRNNGYSQAVNSWETQNLWEVCTYLGDDNSCFPHRSILILEETARDHIKILPQMHWICSLNKRVPPLCEKLTGENYSSKLRPPHTHDWNNLYFTSFIQFISPHSTELKAK